MKVNKKQLTVAILSIAILLAGIVVLILQYALPFAFMTHPILNMLFIYAICFGIMACVFGITKKSPWYYFLAAILLSLAIIYVFVQFKFWWIGLIIAVVFDLIVAIFSYISAGNKTESIAINDSPDYKNYEQRKAEKETKEAAEEKPELPKIKSFKD